jgi:putative membrane protein
VTSLLAVIAAGYGVYLLQAAVTGALYFYIHPLYVVPAVATALVLLALGLAGMLVGAPHGHADAAVRPWAVLALLAPLGLGFLLPPQPLSSLSATARGIDLTSVGAVASGPAFSLDLPTERFSIKDWVKALEVDPEPSRHAGKTVRVTGFAHRDDRLPAGWFLVARFVVKCCAVDAQPLGLLVRAVDHAVPPPGQWITVGGAWEVAEIAGERRAVIRGAAITPTERPAQPYLY